MKEPTQEFLDKKWKAALRKASELLNDQPRDVAMINQLLDEADAGLAAIEAYYRERGEKDGK